MSPRHVPFFEILCCLFCTSDILPSGEELLSIGGENGGRELHTPQHRHYEVKYTLMIHMLLFFIHSLQPLCTKSRLYRDCVLEISLLAVLGQEVWLQKGEAIEFKSWMELGTRISSGQHSLSQIYMYLPVNLFIGCEQSHYLELHRQLGHLAQP